MYSKMKICKDFEPFQTHTKMKFSYEFSNLYGTVYRTGDLVFTPDGNTVLSPVGNKISMFDLKNHKSETLPIGQVSNLVFFTYIIRS